MAVVNYLYPDQIEIEHISRITLPLLQQQRNSPFLEQFPDKPHDSTSIQWLQPDNISGLMQWRGYGGQPQRVGQLGAQRFKADPGVYGEFQPLDEEQLTTRGQFPMGHTFGEAIKIDDLISAALEQTLIREIALKEWILSKLLCVGTYNIPDPQNAGATIHTDSFTPQTFSSSISWGAADKTTPTPLLDLQAIALVPFGASVDIVTSEISVNRLTLNNLFANRNPNDIWGLRNQYGATVTNDLSKLNAIFAGQGLPQIRLYDGFYLADNGTRNGSATRFIPNNKGVFIGRRANGEKIGEFAITRNQQAGYAPASYVRVIDKREREIPGTIEVHRGFNGGPAMKFPSSHILCTF